MDRLEPRLDSAVDEGQAARIDAATMQKPTRTPQGYLRVPVHATRTGVFTYLNPDGTIRRELRHPEDVFAPESLATLRGIPVTDDHPNLKDPNVILISADNTKNYMVGFTGDEAHQDGDHVATVATITDADVINNIIRGKREVSCGYACQREHVPGEYNGMRYDVRQRNIVYNHLAVVNRGRAGSTVRLRLDSADAVQVDDNFLEDNMEEIVINGVKYQVSKAVADAYNSEQAIIQQKIKDGENAKAALDAANGTVTTERKRADTAQARCDTLESELQKAKTDLAARTDSVDPKVINEAAKKRMRVLDVAKRSLTKEALGTLDSMDDQAIMQAVIKQESPATDLASKSSDYIEARFDSIAEVIEKTSGKGREFGSQVGDNRNSGANNDADFDAEAARKRSMEESQNAWKTKADNK